MNDNVGNRLNALFHPDDVVPDEPKARQVVGRQFSDADEPQIADSTYVESLRSPVPDLDPEIGERIRSLLREGDWPSAAHYAEMVMTSIGVDPDPEGGRQSH